MVIAYHVVISFYSFWLPNDPRGSNSAFVRSWRLLPFGRATKVEHRRSVARKSHDRECRFAAKRALAHDPVKLTGRQALSVSKGFADAARRSGYRIHACAVMPAHVHLAVGRHHYSIEQVVNRMKGAATRQLVADGLHPFLNCRNGDGSLPSVWAVGMRKVFLNTPAEVWDRIDYVNDNPEEAGLPRQKWSFVVPYDGREF